MRPIVLPVLLALTALPPVGARAETPHPLTGDGRYQLMEVNDRIVRLDTRTGRFDLCRMEGTDWSCTATRDQRAELEGRIVELTRRVEALEKERTASAAVSASAVSASAVSAPVVQVPAAALPAPVVVDTPPRPRAESRAEPQGVATTDAGSDEFSKVADVVPPVEVGRVEGRPMVIAPVPPAPEKPGLVKRITGLLPDLW